MFDNVSMCQILFADEGWILNKLIQFLLKYNLFWIWYLGSLSSASVGCPVQVSPLHPVGEGLVPEPGLAWAHRGGVSGTGNRILMEELSPPTPAPQRRLPNIGRAEVQSQVESKKPHHNKH